MPFSKEDEMELLLKRIFPALYPSVQDPPVLLKICRDLGDEYCLRFEETGFTQNYQEKCDPQKVLKRCARSLTDDNLLSYCKKYKEFLNKYRDFKGERYTYNHRTQEVRLESQWPRLEKRLHDLVLDYPRGTETVLEAIWEVNIEHDKKLDNWWAIHTVAKNKGLGRGWIKIIEELDLLGIIDKHKGDISIPEEMIDFWSRFLELPYQQI